MKGKCGMIKFDNDKYELIQEERIEELKSDGYLFRHRKSGARVLILANDDENKVFSIGFRTPPPDSTGVPHILEHSVLCGSAKYPVKDPFIELVKGSLNTFLNAMTYPDKTVYPVASCNDVDYRNLMDVYMDAVFNPNIYTRKEIFMQEGWHYELESAQAPLKYNGVVYNEMKGAYSSPDDVLNRYCLNSLYPDTAYSVESGGDPDSIPDLSYEDFLAFHKKLYHPSNSYIYLYGNCDMAERLEYLDREYLSHYDCMKVDSEIKTQKPFESMHRVEAQYSVTEDEGISGRTYLSYNLSVGDTLDKKLYIAMQILDYALFSAPGAQVRQALIDAGIGDDIICSYESSLKQPMFTIAAKNTDEDRVDEFLRIINDTLTRIADDGINKDTLMAGINSMEFRYREADFGQFPKGLMYGLSLMDSWLYDEKSPFIHLAQNDTYEFLKNNIDTGYFEGLVRRYLLENTHTSLVILKPVINLTSDNDAKVAEKLAAYKASLSAEEIERLVKETKELKEYQSEPSTDEELKTIPMLTRDDIRKEPAPLYNDFEEISGVTVDHHNVYTNDVGYLKLSFDIGAVDTEDIPYVGLLGTALGYVDTDSYTYEQISNEIDIHTGGITSGLSTYENIHTHKVSARFNVDCKAIGEEYAKAMDLTREMIFNAHYDDYKRMKEILAEIKSRLQNRMVSAGHSSAVLACNAQYLETSRYSELTSGISYYRFISDLYDNFEERKEIISSKLNKITERIFTVDRLIVSLTGDDTVYTAVRDSLAGFIDGLPDVAYDTAERNFRYTNIRRAYKSASQVNYVARCGSFGDKGIEYSPALKVFKTIMDYDYLWINIRVKGGAYGCMNGYNVTGNGYFCSYRDPNLKQTDIIYEGIPEYIRNFNATEREMTKYIIGTFSGLDIPLTPQRKGSRSFESWMRGADEEYYRKDRAGVLNTYQDDIKALEPLIKAILSDNRLCVIGNSGSIDDNAELFDEIYNLL